MNRAFDTAINTNDQSIERVLAAGLPVALIFFNSALSTELQQSVDRLAAKHAGQLLVAKVEMSQNPATVKRFGVEGDPSVLTVKNENIVSQAQSITGTDLAPHIDYLLGNGPKPESLKRISAENGDPLIVTEASFGRDVLEANQPVLVDFWAPWCGPCRMVEPMLKKLTKEYAGRLRVAKVNVDENPGLSNQLGVQGIPTMMIVQNGQITDRWSGVLPEPLLRSRIQQFIKT